MRLALSLALALALTSISRFAFAQDSFERHLTFKEGTKYAGEPLDLSATRSLIELSEHDILGYGLEIKAGDVDRSKFAYVANFRHLQKYWVARIPKSGVRRAIFQFQNLSSLAKKGIPKPVLTWMRMGHVQMRFQMRENSPVVLKTQVIGEAKQTARVYDFSYALNAVRSVSNKGQAFDPLGDGMHSGYGLSHTFISTTDSMDYFKTVDLNVEQYSMSLTSSQAEKMLQTYIRTSLTSVETEVYNTLAESCVTSTMNGIYSAVTNKPVLWFGRFWRNWRWFKSGSKFENNPRAVVALLVKQGYVRTSDRIPNLEIEAKIRDSKR